MKMREACRWCFVSFGGRPMWTPRDRARFLPSPVRARIRSRSNSARPPSTVSINLPCAVVVSAHASANERKPAPAFAIASMMLRRSRVDRASRSSRVTSSVSPSAIVFKARVSSLRSAFAPLAVSRWIRAAPAALSAAICASSVCPSVLTRAYPIVAMP